MKCYYVDGHEKTEVIAYRRNFVRRYFEQEQRMFRWIQIPLLEVEAMEEAGELQKRMGQRYNANATGQRLTTTDMDDNNMRGTILNSDEHFGTYSQSAEDGQLFLGDTQSMQFKPSDRGPYYLLCEERERQRHDRQTGKTLTKNKTKEMILNDLKERGINTTPSRDEGRKDQFGNIDPATSVK
jgi:hypothetical protein